MKEPDYAKFNVLERITQLRRLNNLSVYKLSKLSGIPQSTISSWYQKNYYPPVDKLEIICSVFGITLSEFFRQDRESDYMITAEDSVLLGQWHRLSRFQKELLESLVRELQKE